MSFYTQLIVCWAAFGVTAALVDPPENHLSRFATVQDFLEFKKDRRLMWCRMEPELTENEDWVRDVPTCSFGGYYPSEPVTDL